MPDRKQQFFSEGWQVEQMLDATDGQGNAYSEDSTGYKPRPGSMGAVWTWVVDSLGVKRLTIAAGKTGSYLGALFLQKTGTRKRGVFAYVCAGKITTASPLKATPVDSAAAGVPTVATTLAEVPVSTVDGSTPALNSFGVILRGTDNSQQSAIFFAGGSGGSSFVWYKITVNNADGTYKGKVVPYPNGTTSGSDVDLIEDNHAPAVPVGQFVRVTSESDGNKYFLGLLGCS